MTEGKRSLAVQLQVQLETLNKVLNRLAEIATARTGEEHNVVAERCAVVLKTVSERMAVMLQKLGGFLESRGLFTLEQRQRVAELLGVAATRVRSVIEVTKKTVSDVSQQTQAAVAHHWAQLEVNAIALQSRAVEWASVARKQVSVWSPEVLTNIEALSALYYSPEMGLREKGRQLPLLLYGAVSSLIPMDSDAECSAEDTKTLATAREDEPLDAVTGTDSPHPSA